MTPHGGSRYSKVMAAVVLKGFLPFNMSPKRLEMQMVTDVFGEIVSRPTDECITLSFSPPSTIP